MFLHERLYLLCRELGARFLDLMNDLSTGSKMAKDGTHYNLEGAHLVPSRVTKVANIFSAKPGWAVYPKCEASTYPSARLGRISSRQQSHQRTNQQRCQRPQQSRPHQLEVLNQREPSLQMPRLHQRPPELQPQCQQQEVQPPEMSLLMPQNAYMPLHGTLAQHRPTGEKPT